DNFIKDGLCLNNIIRCNIFRNIEAVKDIYPDSDGNGMEAIQVGQMTSLNAVSQNLATIIEKNSFEQFIGDQVEVISVKSSSNKITDNEFINCKGGVSIRAGNNNQIIDNRFLRVGRAIRLYGSGHRVENNMLQDVQVGIMIPSADFRTGEKLTKKNGYYIAENCLIARNIIINATDKAIVTGNSDKKILPKLLKFKDNKVLSNIANSKDDKVSIRVSGSRDFSFHEDNLIGSYNEKMQKQISYISFGINDIGPNWEVK